MSLLIEGIKTEILSNDKNLVDVADRLNIRIPAPCYRSRKSMGCCNICAVDVNGEIKSACCTKPKNGMNIIVNRADILEIRKERIKIYKNTPKELLSACDCNCECNSDPLVEKNNSCC